MLINFLSRPSYENLLSYAKKVTDLLINEEALWVTNKEKLDEKKPRWLDTSVIADALDVKGRAGVGVKSPPAESISDTFLNCLVRAKSRPSLLVYLLKENRLTHGEKVNDLLIDDEASWLK